MEYVIVYRGLVGTTAMPSEAEDGDYLESYDPEAYDGRGWATWSPLLGDAMRFPTVVHAIAMWRSQPVSRPTRPDGKVNLPLTAFTVEVVGVETARAEYSGSC
ncbi:MAG: hypothetical protein ACHQX3_00300 [Nitrospirales bacterium]|jgi:hypothetical protein